MTEHSFPFNTGQGANAAEDEWFAMARQWAPDAVDVTSPADGSGLRLVTTGGMVSKVSAGSAFVHGFGYVATADLVPLPTFTHDAVGASGRKRIDSVVLRLVRSTRAITAVVIKGDEAINPIPPAITRNDNIGIWDLPIGDALLTFGSTNITSIADRRPMYSSAKVSKLVRRLGAGFDAWNTTAGFTGLLQLDLPAGGPLGRYSVRVVLGLAVVGAASAAGQLRVRSTDGDIAGDHRADVSGTTTTQAWEYETLRTSSGVWSVTVAHQALTGGLAYQVYNPVSTLAVCYDPSTV